MSVAQTIRDQIGSRALYMIGAKELCNTGKGLRFRIMRNEKGVTHVVVTLDPSDTYTLEFWRVTRAAAREPRLLESHADIYCDQLREVIERATGLALSL